MIIYPAIDIKDGRCVRLIQGDFSRETVFLQDPVEAAKNWEKMGASWIHIVDLDGAKSGKPRNFEVIKQIREKIRSKIQLGGGVRDLEVIKKYFDAGIDRLIFGSAVIESPVVIKEAAAFYGPEKIAAGIDVKNNMVAIKGWTRVSEISLDNVLEQIREIGINIIVYTDISRDGMMSGPDLEGLKKIMGCGGFKIIASGGISSMEDLEKLSCYEDRGVEGVIIGKALYSGALNLNELIQRFSTLSA